MLTVETAVALARSSVQRHGTSAAEALAARHQQVLALDEKHRRLGAVVNEYQQRVRAHASAAYR